MPPYSRTPSLHAAALPLALQLPPLLLLPLRKFLLLLLLHACVLSHFAHAVTSTPASTSTSTPSKKELRVHKFITARFQPDTSFIKLEHAEEEFPVNITSDIRNFNKSVDLYVFWNTSRMPQSALPHMLLMTRKNGSLPHAIVSGESLVKPAYACSQSIPCFDRNTVLDRTAFFTRDPVSRIRLRNVKPGHQFRVKLQSYRRSPLERNPKAEGSLTVLLARSDAAVCEHTRNRAHQCGGSSRGRCRQDAECECITDLYQGRFCKTRVERVMSMKDMTPPEYVLKPGQQRVFRWRNTERKSVNLSVFATLLGRDHHRRQLELVVKPPNANGGLGLEKGTYIPTFYDRQKYRSYLVTVRSQLPRRFRGRIKFDGGELPSWFFVTNNAIPANGQILISLRYRFPSSLGIDQPKNLKDMRVALSVRPCGALLQQRCPQIRMENPNPHAVSLLILPVCLSVLCLVAAVVCLLLYFDRQHGFVTGPDKLSPKELGLMCPEYIYTQQHAAEDAVAEGERNGCSICICDFEVGDHLRRLRCNHSFHSECVDPWLTDTNASCPTCRQEARIPELSERRILRACVKCCLGPLFQLSLLLERRRHSGPRYLHPTRFRMRRRRARGDRDNQSNTNDAETQSDDVAADPSALAVDVETRPHQNVSADVRETTTEVADRGSAIDAHAAGQQVSLSRNGSDSDLSFKTAPNAFSSRSHSECPTPVQRVSLGEEDIREH